MIEIQNTIMGHSRIILIGKTACGKTFLKDKFTNRGFSNEVSYTTRLPREGEINGVDYFFVTEEIFVKMIEEGQMFEHVNFNGNYYGTSVEQWNSKNLFIFNVEGVKLIPEEDRKSCFIIYIDTNEQIRRQRLITRGDSQDKINKRIEADEIEFEGLTENMYDLKIQNS